MRRTGVSNRAEKCLCILQELREVTLQARGSGHDDQLAGGDSFFLLHRKAQGFPATSTHPIPLHCGFIELGGSCRADEYS